MAMSESEQSGIAPCDNGERRAVEKWLKKQDYRCALPDCTGDLLQLPVVMLG